MGVRFPSPAPPGMAAPYSFESFVGRLGVWEEERTILQIGFLGKGEPHRKPSGRGEKSVVSQLQGYFEDPTRRVRLAARLLPPETDMQGAFRRLLGDTTAGELLTYSTVARMLGTSARAVGGLCASNPYPIIVPCHRVIAKTGLGGYTGPHDSRKNLALKRRLIAHERAAIGLG